MPIYNGTGIGESITGSGSADSIYGNGGDDWLDGGSGADRIYGGEGGDTIIGGPLYENDVDYLYGQEGDDTIIAGYGDVVSGGDGYDRLGGSYQNAPAGVTVDFTPIWSGTTITIGGGSISGMEALAAITGSIYGDHLTTGSLAGTTAELYGWYGADILIGGAGKDHLEGYHYGGNGGTDADQLYGLDGNDLLGGGVNSLLDGGNGIDSAKVDYAGSSGGVTADFTAVLGGATATLGGITLIGIEHIQIVNGSGHDDVFDASADQYSFNYFYGYTSMYGNAGNDTLIGSAGNDYLHGGTGNDTMTGGAGDDGYNVDSYQDLVVEGVGGGTDSINSTVDITLAANVENLTLGGTAVLGRGNALANTINGNASANHLRGMDGADTLNGNGGADTLLGGAGRDLAYGGAGADNFQFFPGDFAGLTATTADLITDFSQADSDRISLNLVDAVAGGADDAFAFLGAAAFTGAAGQLRTEFSGGTTMIYGDTNGDGIADFAIALTGNIALTSTDFVL